MGRNCAICEREGMTPECCYCKAPLSTRHEHDHMPKPARHGGTETLPVCLNCHDLKDRVSVLNWTADAFFEAFDGLPPIALILMARTVAWQHDLKAREAELEAAKI